MVYLLLMNEIWRDIPGFEGYYQASTLGRIKSLSRTVTQRLRNGDSTTVYIEGQIMSQQKSNKGYFRVGLRDGKKKTYHGVHRLVALTFPEICGEYFDGAEVMHLDEDPANNKATNLRWGTHTENNNWGTRLNKARKTLTNRTDQSKVIEQYTITGEFIRTWDSLHEIKRDTNYHRGIISDCCKGKYKQAYGYVWKYK